MNGLKPVAGLIIVLSFLTLAGKLFINVADANPASYSVSGSSNVNITIISPTNETYETNSIQVTIAAEAYPGIWYVGYSLDDEPFTELAPEKWDGHTFNESIWLNGISKGPHNLVAKAIAPVAPNDVVNACSQVCFTVATGPEPTPTPEIPEIAVWLVLPLLMIAPLFIIIMKKNRNHLRASSRSSFN